MSRFRACVGGVLELVAAPRIAFPNEIPGCRELLRASGDRDMQCSVVIVRDCNPSLFSAAYHCLRLRRVFPTRQDVVESVIHLCVEDDRDPVQQGVAKISWVHSAVISSRPACRVHTTCSIAAGILCESIVPYGTPYTTGAILHEINGLERLVGCDLGRTVSGTVRRQPFRQTRGLARPRFCAFGFRRLRDSGAPSHKPNHSLHELPAARSCHLPDRSSARPCQ